MRLLALLAICSGMAFGQACAAAHEPTTINSNWTQEGCNAVSNVNPPSSCNNGAVTTCYYTSMPFFHDVAVQVGDSIYSFCDGDGLFSSGTFGVVDNALGTGTVNTANSGGNTILTKASGPAFNSSWIGGSVLIFGVVYPITSVNTSGATSLTVTGNIGTFTGAIYEAGNAFSLLTPTNFSIANGSNTVRGNLWYLLGSAYAVSSGYTVYCQIVASGVSPTIGDMDISMSSYRQTGSGASAGVITDVWHNVTSSGTSSLCGGNTCYSLGTTNSITIPANSLLVGVQQQNNATVAGSTFSIGGTEIPGDNDGTYTGGWYYSVVSNTAASGSPTATFYEANPSDPGAITIFAMEPTASSSACAAIVLGPITLFGPGGICP